MKLAAFVLGTIPLLVQFYAKKYINEDRIKTLNELEGDFGIPRIKTYDFIVVGGGTAGCLVAGRLSEKFNVLLLEAGGTPVPQSNVPYFTRAVHYDPDINYIYDTVPQKNFSLGTNGAIVNGLHPGVQEYSFQNLANKVSQTKAIFDMKNLITQQGKMLGGSGSHNDMGHQRGSPWDYDNYAKITNDPTWNYANVLPFFKKSENFIGTLYNPDESEYYGKGGPLTVDTHSPAILPKWFQAGIELGFKVADPNGFQVESFAPYEKMIDQGKRVSTYTGFIKPFEGIRPNLTVVRYADVSEILIDKSNTAYGVAYLRHGIPQIAHASKEVILSAGAINSPLILMRSGVGPQAMLQEAQIPVKMNLPGVGENFADHADFFLPSFTFNASGLDYVPRIPEDAFEAALTEYLTTGLGEFGELQESPQAFFVSSRAKAEGEGHWPDGRIYIDVGCPTILEDDQQIEVCFVAQLARAKSKGRVTLNTTAYREGITDYTKLALIDLNTFAVPDDIDVIVEGIKLIFRIIEETDAFKSLGARYYGTPEPSCSQHGFRTDAYWKCCINNLGSSALHMTGTTSMGNGPMAVTDSNLRVRGVSRLRVVDAGVLPESPNANINGPVILVAEKASDVILKSW